MILADQSFYSSDQLDCIVILYLPICLFFINQLSVYFDHQIICYARRVPIKLWKWKHLFYYFLCVQCFLVPFGYTMSDRAILNIHLYLRCIRLFFLYCIRNFTAHFLINKYRHTLIRETINSLHITSLISRFYLHFDPHYSYSNYNSNIGCNFPLFISLFRSIVLLKPSVFMVKYLVAKKVESAKKDLG